MSQTEKSKATAEILQNERVAIEREQERIADDAIKQFTQTKEAETAKKENRYYFEAMRAREEQEHK